MKKQTGITLIALIITIIVMLILVGVTINVAINGGLLTTAQRAATEMSKAQIQERAEIVKITLMADLERDNDTMLALKQEYANKLATEFGVSEDNVNANKVIVENGKYDIIIKNADLDIEVREHSDYVDKSSIITLEFNDENIVENNKIYGINLSINLKENIDKDSYVLQELENNKEEPTDEEKKEAVLELMSQKVSEVKDIETTIESTDEYFVELFNYMANKYNISTHDTLDSWFEDENFPQGIELFFDLEEGMGEKIKTRSDLYNLYMGNTDLTVEVTEGQFIEYIYTNEIQTQQENEERSTYVEEYNNNTKNLNLYVMHNGEREDIAQGIDVESTQEYFINENGEYIFILEDSEGKKISSETIILNNIEESEYVLTEEEAEELWQTNKNGTITKYLGKESSVVVPMYIGKEYINAIGDQAFSTNNAIQNVTISNSINKIGYGAFSSCASLTEIIIPDSVESIGNNAFAACTRLNSITIPNSVNTIRSGTFVSCKSLTEIIIPNSITSIEEGAFRDCSCLKEIVIPDSVISIETRAFMECASLEKVKLSEKLTSIPGALFSKCTSLKEVVLPDSIIEIDGLSAFAGCTSLEKVELSENLTYISEYTFNGCTKLKDITIPDKVTSIQYYAFYGCESLTEITIPKLVTNINSNTFGGCINLTNIYVEEGSTLTIPETTPWGAPNATATVLPAEQAE